MMSITLVTSNQNKLEEFRQVLEPEIRVKWLNLEYPEIRSDDVADVAASAVFSLSKRLNKVLVVEDSGLFIDALNGFPGTLTKEVAEKIGNEGILALMKGKQNRSCKFWSAVALCSPNNRPKIFIGEERGQISTKILGKGWGQDSIFLPLGKKRTYGQHKKGVRLFRRRALMRLKEVITNEKSTGKNSRSFRAAKQLA